MSWLVVLLVPASFLAAPPDDSSVPNRPLAVKPRVESKTDSVEKSRTGIDSREDSRFGRDSGDDSRSNSRTESRVDPEVIRAIGDRPAVKEGAPTEIIQASEEVAPDGRKPITISPSTLKKEGLGKRLGKDEDPSARPLPPNKSIAWWTTTGIGLAVVLVVIFVGGRVARRVVPGAVVGESSGPIQLLHRTFLTPKHTVCLVRCGDRLLLVGLSGDRMQNLSEIHDPQEIDFIRGQLMQVRPRSTTQAFRDVLSGKSQLEEALKKPAGDREESGPGPAFAMSKEDGATATADDVAAPRKRDFMDHVSALRSQISQWKSKAGTA